jgi:dihydroorotase
MNLRSAVRHREPFWFGAQGIADILGSDHADYLDEGGKAYPQSPSGMTGVQTLVPVMLDREKDA